MNIKNEKRRMKNEKLSILTKKVKKKKKARGRENGKKFQEFQM